MKGGPRKKSRRTTRRTNTKPERETKRKKKTDSDNCVRDQVQSKFKKHTRCIPTSAR